MSQSKLHDHVLLCSELSQICLEIINIEGAQKLQKQISAEHKFLLKVKTKDQECRLRGTNLPHYAAILHAALSFTQVSHILAPFNTPDGESVVVDVITGHGHIWVKVIARNARALHAAYTGCGDYGERDIISQTHEYLRCAKLHPVFFKPPCLFLCFYNGVTKSVASEIVKLGAVVIGDVMDDMEFVVLSDVENVMENVAVGGCEFDGASDVGIHTMTDDVIGRREFGVGLDVQSRSVISKVKSDFEIDSRDSSQHSNTSNIESTKDIGTSILENTLKPCQGIDQHNTIESEKDFDTETLDKTLQPCDFCHCQMKTMKSFKTVFDNATFCRSDINELKVNPNVTNVYSESDVINAGFFTAMSNPSLPIATNVVDTKSHQTSITCNNPCRDFNTKQTTISRHNSSADFDGKQENTKCGNITCNIGVTIDAGDMGTTADDVGKTKHDRSSTTCGNHGKPTTTHNNDITNVSDVIGNLTNAVSSANMLTMQQCHSHKRDPLCNLGLVIDDNNSNRCTCTVVDDSQNDSIAQLMEPSQETKSTISISENSHTELESHDLAEAVQTTQETFDKTKYKTESLQETFHADENIHKSQDTFQNYKDTTLEENTDHSKPSTSQEQINTLLLSFFPTTNIADHIRHVTSILPILRASNLHDAVHIQQVNLDITALVALVSALSHGRTQFVFKEGVLTTQAQEERRHPVLPRLHHFIHDRDLYTCESAWKDFSTILNTLGGADEKRRANELKARLTVIPDVMSSRVDGLKTSGRINSRSKVIFGTGDYHMMVTVTANTGFIRAAEKQGVQLAVFEHQARALTEQKEATATLLTE